MNPWSILVRVAAGLLLCGTPALAAPPISVPALEESLRSSMGISADTQFEYQDIKGKPMEADAFAAAISRPGNGVMIDKSRPGKLVLKLKKASAAPQLKGPTHLPALEARDLTGRRVRSLDLAGKHTLVSFYFSTCVPCIQEVPALNAFRESHPELNYLAITFDPAVDARKFVSERKLSWPVLADAGGFLNAAGVRSFPAYMLVAPDGRILGRGAGLALHAKEPTPGLAALEQFVTRHTPLAEVE